MLDVGILDPAMGDETNLIVAAASERQHIALAKPLDELGGGQAGGARVDEHDVGLDGGEIDREAVELTETRGNRRRSPVVPASWSIIDVSPTIAAAAKMPSLCTLETPSRRAFSRARPRTSREPHSNAPHGAEIPLFRLTATDETPAVRSLGGTPCAAAALNRRAPSTCTATP